MPFVSIDPATGKIVKTFDEHSDSDVERKLKHADETFRHYSRTSFQQRAKWMLEASRILESHKTRLAETMTLEMGKPIKAAVAEAEKCAWVCRYYAENAEQFLKDEPIETDAKLSYVRYRPFGAVLAVMPW